MEREMEGEEEGKDEERMRKEDRCQTQVDWQIASHLIS